MRRGSRVVEALCLRSTGCEGSLTFTAALMSFTAAIRGGGPPPHITRVGHNALSLPAPAPSGPHEANATPAECSQSVSATAWPSANPVRRSMSAENRHATNEAEQTLRSSIGDAQQLSQTARLPPGCHAPLCERIAQHAVSADALRAWTVAAGAAIDDVGDAHAAQAGGSTRDELKARSSALTSMRAA